jgi:serine/threonine protein kinase/WD40 repeat protein
MTTSEGHSPTSAAGFEHIADEFADGCARGDSPSVEDYCSRYPEHAAQIRNLFPMIVQMHAAAGDAAESDEFTREFGDFQLVREIGRGGMGVVYEAQQKSLGRRVAIKLLPSTNHTGGRQEQRFDIESRAAARLHHSNIVPVYGVGEHDGLKYYVMQLIDGCGLDDVIREVVRRQAAASGSAVCRSPEHGEPPGESEFAADAASWLMSETRPASDPGTGSGRSGRILRPTAIHAAEVERHRSQTSSSQTISRGSSRSGYWRNVVRLGINIADALQYAHEQGVLHRDIKPSNLMLDTKGQVWIMDFGLAKADDSADLTRTGDLVGTLRYMAPERFNGDSDPRSDVYSLGLTLYELLLLRPAFDATDRNQLIRQLTTSTPPRPRKIRPDLPRDLETILTRACQDAPAARYATAADLRDDLQCFLEGRSISARRASLMDHSVKWIRRQPVVAGLVIGVIASILLGVIGASWQWRKAVIARTAAETAQGEAEAARRETEVANASLYRQLYASDLRLAQSAVEQERRQEAVAFLSRHLPSDEHADIRGFAWRHLWHKCHQGTDLLQFEDRVNLQPAPDGTRLYALETWSAVHVVDRESLSCETILEGPWTRIVLSPDGGLLALQRGRTSAEAEDRETAWLLNTSTNELTGPLPLQLGGISGMAWAADGSALFLSGRLSDPGNGRQQYLRWDVANAEPTAHVEQLRGGYKIACQPESGAVVASRPGFLDFRDPHSLEIVNSLPVDLRDPEIKFSQSGDVVAAVGVSSHAAQILDPATGQTIHTLTGHKLAITAFALMNDGRQLITAASDASIRTWDVETGTLQRINLGHAAGIASIEPVSNHEFLSASYTGGVRHWSITPAATGDISVGNDGTPIADVKWTQDASELLIAKGDRVLRWQASGGDFAEPIICRVQSERCYPSGIAVCSDGALYIGVDGTAFGRPAGFILQRGPDELHPRVIATLPDRIAAIELAPMNAGWWRLRRRGRTARTFFA